MSERKKGGEGGREGEGERETWKRGEKKEEGEEEEGEEEKKYLLWGETKYFGRRVPISTYIQKSNSYIHI